jgi:DNA polymerase-3 subunit alpha
MSCGNYGSELETAQQIADMCDVYELKKPISLPKFDCPNNMSSAEHLRHLCREGWRDKIDTNKCDKDTYGDRVRYELSVISEAKLDDYFLITQDYIRWYKENRGLVSTGRGSVAGSLVAYLLGITKIDPIKYGLMFERFYNKGRNTKKKISYPDIDLDFEVEKRDSVIQYIRSKYGESKVSQIATFGRLQGRSALKEVMRVKETLPFDECNNITFHIPDEAQIADELEAMRELGEEVSIIRWALQNKAQELSEWCVLDDNGHLHGELAADFAQAIRLEGTLKSQGKHAAGLVVSQNDLEDTVPMIHDKNSSNLIASLEYEDLESLGLLKLDILGVAVLDKVALCMNLINT